MKCLPALIFSLSSCKVAGLVLGRVACDRPKVIEALRGKKVVKVAAGGAHSAAVTADGELYTWGKGRYGRLGHGDSDDQLRPKLVDALKG